MADVALVTSTKQSSPVSTGIGDHLSPV